ncbi:MAG: insulinase family protein [Acidobacteria bacterium]|nr:insulinase family protein [Acidobacteriota bacterium]
MKNHFNRLIKPAILLAVISLCASLVSAQASNVSAPREEKLLNGLRLIVWSDSKAAKVTVKTRIHSGAAFDPLGKEGVMKLLSEIIFPNESAKEYFRDDLGGSLDVTCGYDYIQIDATGDADKFLTLLETLSSALTNPQINKETTERVKIPHLARLAEIEKDPAYLADRAVAKRLLGSFPYGRPLLGTPESAAKIDFADILFAKQRFLTADNATLAISGNVKADLALRASKRLFGGWLKADKKIPATFAQPAPPIANIQILDTTLENTSELRFAMRGVARNEKDFYAAQILENVLHSRIRSREGERSFARSNANVLPGIVILGVSSWNTAIVKKVGNTIALPTDIASYQNHFLGADVTPAEFEAAKRAVLAAGATADPLNYWLDSQTYRFVSVKDDQTNLQTVSVADVQRVLGRLRKESVASVLLVSTSGSTVAN